MPSNQVSVSRCSNYDLPQVHAALSESLSRLGGIERFVQPGQRVLVKPNLLSPTPPERAVTTDPAVVEAVVRSVQQAGGRPLIAESASSAFPYTPAGLQHLYQVTGMTGVAERTGVELNMDVEVVAMTCPDKCNKRRVEVIRPLAEADVVISLPRLKTHALTVFSGATKNCFGVIPGARKMLYHGLLGYLDDFCDMLLDVAMLANPALVVMDGIVAMDGEGPAAGDPFPLGLLLASDNSIAMDMAATQIVGIPPLDVPVLRRATERGFWPGHPTDVKILGPALSDIRVTNFRYPQARPLLGKRVVPPWLKSTMHWLSARFTMQRPVPMAGRCTACATCVRTCPAKAIKIRRKLARVDDSLCIRCYCCHEVCPERAIELKTPLVRKFVVNQLAGVTQRVRALLIKRD